MSLLKYSIFLWASSRPSHRSPRIAASSSSTVHFSSLHISDLPCNQSPYIDHKNLSFFPPAAIDHLAAGGNLHRPSSNMSFSIAVVAIVGILCTAISLFTYSVFVIKCCLKWRTSDFFIHLFSTSRADTSPPSTTAEPTGLDSAVIRSIPIFCYSSIRSSAASECAVCLSDFRSGEHLRLLPGCSHAFHIDCIDAWLQTKTSCPFCRSRITNPFPPSTDHRIIPNQSVVVEVSEEGIRNQRRRLGPAVSMGDECIEARREKDEIFAVQPLRRSFSLDSSCDPQLYVSVQETLRRNLEMVRGEGSSDGGGGDGGGGGSGRIRRSFFPIGGRSWRSAVQPVNIDVL